MMLTMSKHINDIFTKRCGCHEIWPISNNNSWKHTINSFCIFPAELDMNFSGWLCTLTNTHWTSLNHLGFPHERAWYATCPRDRSRLDLRWHPWLRTDATNRIRKIHWNPTFWGKSTKEKPKIHNGEKHRKTLNNSRVFRGWENQCVAMWLRSNAEALPFGEMPEAT